jgi:uroporphyrinogen decarboxylase
MDYWKEFYKRYVKAQQDAGADAIWLGDCNAFSSMVSVKQYNEFILPVTRDLVKYCEKDLNIMIWMHNSETKLDHLLSHLPLGVSFESIGPDADIRQMREATRGVRPISGNFDPIKDLWQGNPDSIKAEVERIMGICKNGGGFIFNTGEMNPQQTPEENMDAYISAARNLAEY